MFTPEGVDEMCDAEGIIMEFLVPQDKEPSIELCKSCRDVIENTSDHVDDNSARHMLEALFCELHGYVNCGTLHDNWHFVELMTWRKQLEHEIMGLIPEDQSTLFSQAREKWNETTQ